MDAHQACELLLQLVRKSNLNYLISESAFSVSLQIKKTFIKNKDGSSRSSQIVEGDVFPANKAHHETKDALKIDNYPLKHAKDDIEKKLKKSVENPHDDSKKNSNMQDIALPPSNIQPRFPPGFLHLHLHDLPEPQCSVKSSPPCGSSPFSSSSSRDLLNFSKTKTTSVTSSEDFSSKSLSTFSSTVKTSKSTYQSAKASLKNTISPALKLLPTPNPTSFPPVPPKTPSKASQPVSTISSTDSEYSSTKSLFNLLPFTPESHVGKKVFGMTAEELDFTEEEFAQLVDNLGENVT